MRDVKFGLYLSNYPPKETIRCALLAEKYGFDSVWLPDHLTDLPPMASRGDPWAMLSAIGAGTKHIMLAPGVTDTQRRHPAVTANAAATLDEITDGRAAVAIGAGELMNIKPFGLPWQDPKDRIERLAEAIQVIKLLWGSSWEKPVSFGGKYFNLSSAWLDQHPTQKPNPPLYVGSLGSRHTLEIVGKYADGWFPWMNTVETFKHRSGIIRDAAQKSGRSFDEMDMAVVVFVAATEEKHLWKCARDAVRTDALVTTDSKVLKEMGFEVPSEYTRDHKYQRMVPTKETADFVNSVAAKMPDEVVDRFVAIGDSDQLIDRINEYIKVGARHIVIRDTIGEITFLSVDRLEKTLQLLNREVLPYFRENQK
jgi:phthiodiolone/phenolphthiodiolone dimycocerosates ketoreductase